jgi:hypothetical protein
VDDAAFEAFFACAAELFVEKRLEIGASGIGG